VLSGFLNELHFLLQPQRLSILNCSRDSNQNSLGLNLACMGQSYFHLVAMPNQNLKTKHVILLLDFH
jgi:hypothetical protein